MALKDEILAKAKATKGRREAVTLFGETCYVQEMTAKQRDAWEKSRVEVRGGQSVMRDNVRASLLVRVLHNEAGERIFSDEDIEAVGEFPSSEASPIYDVAMRLNSVSEGDLKELSGNS